MNWYNYIFPIAKNVDVLLICIAVLIVMFSWFYIKACFAKNTSLKWYTMLLYSFAALVISCISFILLNAQMVFFNFNSLYMQYWFFFVYITLSVLCGIAIAWLIYNAAEKVNHAQAYNLINYSLLIIAPSLLYVLLLKPFVENFEYTGLKKPSSYKNSGVEVSENTIFYNEHAFKIIKQKPNLVFTPAIPSQLFDSIKLELKNGSAINITINGGLLYTYPLHNINLEQMYVATLKNYLAILACSNGIYHQSSLILIDKNGNIAFLKNYYHGTNRLAINVDKEMLLLSKETNGKFTFEEVIKTK